MWIEAVLNNADLVRIAEQLAPLEIKLGDDSGGSLKLTNPREIKLLPAVGLHINCSGKLLWPVLGVKLPVTFHALRVRVLPRIDKTPTGDTLAFKLEVEHADIAAVPDVVDDHITDMVNRELAKKGFSLNWDFTDTLTNTFKLPESFVMPRGIGVKVKSGIVRITDDTLVLAISFDSQVERHDEGNIGEYTEAHA
ncbi:MAG TPA: hypothetical protein VF407_17675 [Polyangiaceae bacterium]